MKANTRPAAIGGLSWEPPAKPSPLHFVEAINLKAYPPHYRCATCGLLCTVDHQPLGRLLPPRGNA